MHKHWKIALAVLVGILLGAYSMIAYKKLSTMSFANSVSIEIDPFEIISVIVTVGLTIYVTRTLSKINDSEKGEKELLISYLNAFKSVFTAKIIKLSEQDNLASIVTNSDMKILRKKLDSLITITKEHNFVGNDHKGCADLSNKMRDIWELFTEAPAVSHNAGESATVADSINRLRLEQLSKIETNIIEFDKLFFELVIEINKK